MSETYQEKVKSFESLEKDHSLAERSEAPAQPAEQAGEKQQDKSELLAQARQELEHTPAANINPLERLKASEAAQQTAQPLNITRELKAITVQRELTHIRRKLSAPQRALSKLIHQPAIRAVSETAGKTVSRPSGLLGGSLVAFLGTTSYLYVAKHYGYKYNYLLFFILFFGGFVIGLILELLVHLATASHRRSHD